MKPKIDQEVTGNLLSMMLTVIIIMMTLFGGLALISSCAGG